MISENNKYIAKITNISKSKIISDYVDNINITLPNASYISSMVAKFKTNFKVIEENDVIKIEILDNSKNIIYTFQGTAYLTRETKNYNDTYDYYYEIKENYSKLFEKTISETITYYDLYLCNNQDKHNSLLHKIAYNLGFKDYDLDFENVAYDDGSLIRIAFTYLEEKTRWVDKLQAFIEATNGILYVKNRKLIFRTRKDKLINNFKFNRDNLLTSIDKHITQQHKNGVKVVYDRFARLDNQVVFNVSQKILIEPNTRDTNDTPIMRINYITSSVNNPSITKATGYYYLGEKKNDIKIKENIHYKVVSWKDTGAEIKFINSSNYLIYVENFEISGMPLAMYESNDASVTFKDVTRKEQENFITYQKNKFVQSENQALFLANNLMKRKVINNIKYDFRTVFLPNIKLGGVYKIKLDDIDSTIEITNIKINLRPSNFTMDIQGITLDKENNNLKLSHKLSANVKENFIDLKSIETKISDKIDNNVVKRIDTLQKDFTSDINNVKSENERTKRELSSDIQNTKNDLNSSIQATKNKLDTVKDVLVKDLEKSIDTRTKNLTKEMEEQKRHQEIINKKMVAKLHKQTNQPFTNLNEYDIWLNPNTNVFKQYVNYRWLPIAEKDILPSIKHYNSLENAQLSMGTKITTIERENKSNIANLNTKIDNDINAVKRENKNNIDNVKNENERTKRELNNNINSTKNDLNNTINSTKNSLNSSIQNLDNKVRNLKIKDFTKDIEKVNERAGIFLTNNDQKFGTINDLAEVSLDKQGTIRLKNVNNLLEWNVKNPYNPKKLRSKFYMGVTDVTKVPDNVYFKIGDSSNGFSLELKDNGSQSFKIGNDEITEKFNKIDRNINSTKNSLNSAINSTKNDLNNSTNSKINATESKLTSRIDNKVFDANRTAYYLSLMSNAKMIYTDPEFKNGRNNTYTYLNRGDNLKTYVESIPKGSENYPPNTSGKVLVMEKYKKQDTSPGAGGFYFATPSRKDAIFLTKIIAKIPKGCQMELGTNSVGVHPKIQFLSSQEGTGRYETYYILVICGDEPEQYGFSTTNFFYITGDIDKPFKWYVAYATVFDCTANDERIDETKEKIEKVSTELSNEIHAQGVSVQEALDNGNFVVTGNTSFDGNVNFVSRGTNEVLSIANGGITFSRDGQALTRVKNFRIGSTLADSKGSYIIDFKDVGFKAPLKVHTSIRNFNFGKNLASVFCYAEPVNINASTNTAFRFKIGGSTEETSYSKPVLYQGTVATENNVFETTFKGFSLLIDKTDKGKEEYFTTWISKSGYGKNLVNYDTYTIKSPRFIVNILRNGEKIFQKEYTCNTHIINKHHTAKAVTTKYKHEFPKTARDLKISGRTYLTVNESTNIYKKYNKLTNVKYEIVVQITQPDFDARDGSHSHSSECFGPNNNKCQFSYISTLYKGNLVTIKNSDFKGFKMSIANNTKNIKQITDGKGEINYIVMEEG